MLINYYSNINFFQSLSLIKLRYQKSEKLPLEGLDSEFFEVEQKMSGVTRVLLFPLPKRITFFFFGLTAQVAKHRILTTGPPGRPQITHS